jgi:hypothetical protein
MVLKKFRQGEYWLVGWGMAFGLALGAVIPPWDSSILKVKALENTKGTRMNAQVQTIIKLILKLKKLRQGLGSCLKSHSW